MHVYFSGIGGTGIGPLALIAAQAGCTVSGSDKQDSQYISYLRGKGLENIHIGQSERAIAAVHDVQPIDWYVYSSAVVKENADAPELTFCKKMNIRTTKRDEFLNHLLSSTNKKMIAVAGTHGKTTTTAMIIWLFLQLKVPVSYSVGAKTSFCDMGHFDPTSEYFVYECDEFDRNFLAFHPEISAITGVTWDHHEIFPTIENYRQAFSDFLAQSQETIGWDEDEALNGFTFTTRLLVEDKTRNSIRLAGEFNRRDALLACLAVARATRRTLAELLPLVQTFPGTQRRFEKLIPSLYTDYAHTPEKILGAMSVALETAQLNKQPLVVVYEPLTNRRMHYMAEQHKQVFDGAEQVIWVPSYLAREDPTQAVLTPQELIDKIQLSVPALPAKLDESLREIIGAYLQKGSLVLCLSGGGGNGLDEWLRANFVK
jgi:UDP-N-acetylmuramate--alanine ligase